MDFSDYVLVGLAVAANVGLYGLYQLVKGVEKNLLPSYFGEKGKNLATQEDIAEITKLTEEVKEKHAASLDRLRAELARDTERLKSELALETNSSLERLKGALHLENTSQVEHLKAFLTAAVARERQSEEREADALLAFFEAVQQLVIRDILRSINGLHALANEGDIDELRRRLEESYWGAMHAYLKLQMLAVRNVDANKAGEALVRHLSENTTAMYTALHEFRMAEGDSSKRENSAKCTLLFSTVAGESFPLLFAFIQAASRGRGEAIIAPLRTISEERRG